MNRTIRCKFAVDKIEKNDDGGRLTASPVVYGSEENEQFFRYTPGGYLDISTVRAEVLDLLKPGQEFYLDLLPIETEPQQA